MPLPHPEVPVFPLATSAEVAQYIEELDRTLEEDFADTNGLPDLELPDTAIGLPGLLIVSKITPTGYQFRTAERNAVYHEKVKRNQTLMLQGKMNEVEHFDWEDPDYTLEELTHLLIALKNEEYPHHPPTAIYYIQLFVEMETPKKRMMELLSVLKQLHIDYKEVYG